MPAPMRHLCRPQGSFAYIYQVQISPPSKARVIDLSCARRRTHNTSRTARNETKRKPTFPVGGALMLRSHTPNLRCNFLIQPLATAPTQILIEAMLRAWHVHMQTYSVWCHLQTSPERDDTISTLPTSCHAPSQSRPGNPPNTGGAIAGRVTGGPKRFMGIPETQSSVTEHSQSTHRSLTNE